MNLAERPVMDDPWSRLQQPGRPAGQAPHLLALLAALDQGWQIETPVYLRRRWGETGEWMYHFVLAHPRHAARLLTVAAGPEVERFLRSNGLPVAG